MKLECDDAQASDILSSAHAPVLRLRRLLSLQYDNEKSQGRPGRPRTLANREAVHRMPVHDQKDEVVQALWWPETPPGGDIPEAARARRVLQGELHLHSSLYPTTHLGHFKVTVSIKGSLFRASLTPASLDFQYVAVLYPPNIAGFTPAVDPKTVLQSTPVKIATVYPSGPRPITYSKPNHPPPPGPSQRRDMVIAAFT